uniref:Apolipoprotein Ea n=1 Tax=Monopterus albus TaxID=43700 RepID=A0A3Q3JJD3_MONAL
MRVFAVILALAVLSGCHARSVPQDDGSDFEDTVQKFKDYLTYLNSKVDEVVKDIQSSETVRELDTLVQDSMSELAMYRDDLQNKLAPYAQETAERLGKDLQLLAGRLHNQMAETREQLVQYTQEAQTMMEQDADDSKLRVSTYSQKLNKRLNKDMEEIKKHVSEYLEELQSRTSDNMEDAKSRLQPYFAQVQDNAQAKVTTLSDLLTKQVENMKEEIQGDMKEQFLETAQNMQFSLGEKVEEMRIWFQPLVSTIRDNITGYR